jgi:hypothetical protein
MRGDLFGDSDPGEVATHSRLYGVLRERVRGRTITNGAAEATSAVSEPDRLPKFARLRANLR